MAEGRITNSGGAYGYTALDQTSSRTVWEATTTTAVTKGDVLCWGTQATDTGPLVHISVQGTDDPASVAGVALHACAANKIVQFVRNGPCLINIGTGTVAAWERGVLLAGTPGAADGDAHDGSDIVGDSFGVFLGAEIGTTNQAAFVMGSY